MTRRQYLLAGLAGLAKAQDSPLPHDYSRVLPEFLQARVAELYEARTAEQSTLTFVNMVQQRQKEVRKLFWKLNGPQPERSPLQLRTVGSRDEDGYRVERLAYESRPGLLISANLYVPTVGKAPFPGVLFQMGHGPLGKAHPSYQRCCQGLARLGYLVLAFDPLGQGERVCYLDAKGSSSLVGGPTAEHTHLGRQLLLLGQTLAGWMVWDAMRSLDVLAAHPLVDPQRLASAGQSGGGTLTMLLLAVDDRLRCAAVTCGNTENFLYVPFLPPGPVDDAEQNLLPIGPDRLEHFDLLTPFVPRPLLLLASSHDPGRTYSPAYLASGRVERQTLERMYNVLGQTADLRWVETPAPHGLDLQNRLEIYRWFSRNVKLEPASTAIEEPPTSPVDPTTLAAAPDGNVFRAGWSRTPWQLIAGPRWPERQFDPQQLRAHLRTTPAQPVAPWVERGRVPTRFGRLVALELTTEPGVDLPAWLFQPSVKPKAALLLLDERGRNAHSGEGDLCYQLAAAGILVCAADVRGTGDATPALTPAAPAYAHNQQTEEAYAWASLMVGRPLLGQWVQDVSAWLAALNSATNLRPQCAARGVLALPALCSAALDPLPTNLWCQDGLASWQSIISTELYKSPFSTFLPGILQKMDLPVIAASLAPRHLVLGNPQDGAGESLTAVDSRKLYPGDHVRHRPGMAWTASALIEFCTTYR